MDMEVADAAGGAIRVRLSGRLDAAGVDRIETRFTATVVPPGRPVLVDLSSVSFVASMGLRMLIGVARALAGRGATLVLYGADDQVGDVLAQTAVDQIIPVVATEADALARAAG